MAFDIELPETKAIKIDPNKEKLVIQMACLLRAETMQKLQDKMLEQYESGVVVLPRYCCAAVVPKDTPIEIRGLEVTDDERT